MKQSSPFILKELRPADVKKGDVINLVGPYNHFSDGARDRNHVMDSYYYETWTVTACGAKLMRLANNEGNRGHKVWIMNRCGEPGFQTYVCRPGDEMEIIEAMRAQDPFKTEEFRVIERRPFQTARG